MLEEQLKTRIDFLKNLRIFKKSSGNELHAIAEALKDVVAHEGQEIITKGDEAHDMYILAKGKVKIHDGDHVFQTVEKGHVFGEYSLFHSHVRTASVTAIESSFLLRLDQSEFKTLLESNPNFQVSVIQSLVDTIAIQNELEKQLAEKNEEIEIQKKELEKAIKTKDRFFSILAHDLRSPLSNLGSYLNLLIHSDDLTQEETIEFASDIRKSVDGVLEMLDNLLNWAISETGDWQLDPKAFSIKSSIDRVVALYADQAQKKNISIINNSTDLNVNADQTSIDIVLRNILSNAIKYTDDGGEIKISTELEEERIKVCIKDNGKGMDLIEQEKLFNIDIKNNLHRRSSGTGLGLILSKEFAEKNGGELQLESTPNEGSTFCILLPQ